MRHAIQRLLHYSVNTILTANQKCHACRICLNSLLCFTTTDSLTWQRTKLHKELFNLRHTTLWNNPTKAINTKRVIPWNWIEATLIAFSERLHPFQNSERQNPNCRKPRCRFAHWRNGTEATLSQTNYQHADSTPN